MKFLTLSVLALTMLSSTAKANIVSTKQALINVGTPVLAITASPTIFVAAVIECLTNGSPEIGYVCVGATTTAPVSSTVLAVLLKEDIQQVEGDAYNYLAGEEISLALEEQMNKMREQFPALAEKSDEFVIATMLELQGHL